MKALKRVFRSDNLAQGEKDIKNLGYKSGELNSCTGCDAFPPGMKIDDSELYGSAQPTHAQILIATDKTNWKHDISEEEEIWGQVSSALNTASSNLESIVGGSVRINGTDQPTDDVPPGHAHVIILPQFVQLDVTPKNAVGKVAEILALQPGDNLPDGTTPVMDRGFVLFCSHRQRDKRCGVTAPIMRKALNAKLRQEGLYRDPLDDTSGGVRVLFCSHVGGHKWAANALIYQNTGMAVMLARLEPEHAQDLVEKVILKGELPIDHLRSCNKLESYQW